MERNRYRLNKINMFDFLCFINANLADVCRDNQICVMDSIGSDYSKRCIQDCDTCIQKFMNNNDWYPDLHKVGVKREFTVDKSKNDQE